LAGKRLGGRWLPEIGGLTFYESITNGKWKKKLVKDCIVYNIATWNEKMPFQVSRKP
jgi:hypothetical protein